MDKRLLKAVIKDLRIKRKRIERFVYDNTFYQVQAIIRTSKFKSEIVKLYESYDKLGIPVPEQGILSLEPGQEIEWLSTAEKKGAEPMKAVINIALRFGVVPGKGNIEEQQAICNALFNQVFLKRSQSPTKPVDIFRKTDDEGFMTELWVRIYPYTTKDDLINAWIDIDFYRQFFANTPDRLKQWDEFDRDFQLYQIYLRVKERVARGEINKTAKTGTLHVSKSVYEQLMVDKDFIDMSKRYKFSRKSVEKIIRHCNNVLGNLNL